jgi:uncharacterized membrane protein YphA (DoxX/SURF4 family)
MCMAEEKKTAKVSTRTIISLIACIFVGITFLISGSGKLLAFGQLPGQTADFLGYMLPKAWITSVSIFFIYEVLMPYIIPALELALGIFLIIGFMPRLMAVVTALMTVLFMTNNIWSISQGTTAYEHCACFGIWGDIFGTLSPAQSLGYDIVLFALALVIIIITPLRFFKSWNWLENLGHKKKVENKTGS